MQRAAKHQADLEEKWGLQQLHLLTRDGKEQMARAARIWSCLAVQHVAIGVLKTGLDGHRRELLKAAASEKICNFIYNNHVRRQMNALKKRCQNLVKRHAGATWFNSQMRV